MIKALKNLLFAIILVAGFSVGSFAQKSDDKKPPKENPPKVSPTEKNVPKNPPSSGERGDKPKKPNAELTEGIIRIIVG